MWNGGCRCWFVGTWKQSSAVWPSVENLPVLELLVFLGSRHLTSAIFRCPVWYADTPAFRETMFFFCQCGQFRNCVFFCEELSPYLVHIPFGEDISGSTPPRWPHVRSPIEISCPKIRMGTWACTTQDVYQVPTGAIIRPRSNRRGSL